MNTRNALRRSCSVLVMDPDPNVLALVSVILEGPRTSERPGIRVLRARNITEAIDLLSRSYVPVDLVISNSALAETSPCDVAGLVHEVRPTIPLLFMSPMAVTRDIPAGRNGEGAAVQEQATVDTKSLRDAVFGALAEPQPALRAMGAVWSFQRGL